MNSDETALTRGRIVIGTDGSDPSRRALRWAQFLADAMGCTLEAVIAWEPLAGYGWGTAGWTAFPTDWNPAQDAEKVLVEAVDAVFGEHRPPGLETIVREGSAAKVLLEASAGAEMLVVGSRGHGGFAGLLLGSVSGACSEHAACPILVIHGETPPPPGEQFAHIQS